MFYSRDEPHGADFEGHYNLQTQTELFENLLKILNKITKDWTHQGSQDSGHAHSGHRIWTSKSQNLFNAY